MDLKVQRLDHSNIRFVRIEVREAVFRDLADDLTTLEPNTADFEIQMGVRLLVPEGKAEIATLLRVQIFPPKDTQLFQELTVTLAGIFAVDDPGAIEQLREFGLNQAPLLVWPYARQEITTLTSQTRFRGLVLPPLNMQSIVRKMIERGKETAEERQEAEK
jgi:preprotein translocase subunit SecB